MTISTKSIRYINLTTGNSLRDYNRETCVKAKTLKDRIQIGAVGILAHVGTHGNIPQATKLANDLIDGLGQGIQLKALIEWFVEFGLVIAEDGKSFADANIDKIKKEFTRAKQTHWVSFAPITPWAGLNFSDKLTQLFKATDDALVKAATDTDAAAVVSVDEHMLAVMKVVSGMGHEQLQALMTAASMGTVNETEDITVETTDFTAGMEEEEVQVAA